MTLPNLALPLLLMLTLTYAEQMYCAKYRTNPPSQAPWRDVVFNLNSGHIVMWLGRGLEVLAYAGLFGLFEQHMVAQTPVWLQWMLGFVAWDFCFYWMHRMHHRLSWLWAVHVVHHQGEHFNLSLGVRNSWYSSLSNFPFIAILAVLGLPVEIFVVVSSIHYSIQFYNHNALVGRSGILDRFLVTPLHHRVHHGMDAPYIDKNFGGTFLLWDKIFGTHQLEVAEVPLRFGTHQPIGSHNPWIASNLPFVQLFKPLQRLPALKAARHGGYIARAGFVLFVCVIGYVWLEAGLAQIDKVGLFGLIFMGTIAIGAASDEKTWGIWLWFGLSLALAAHVLLMATALSVVSMALSAALLTQTIETAILLHQRSTNKENPHEII